MLAPWLAATLALGVAAAPSGPPVRVRASDAAAPCVLAAAAAYTKAPVEVEAGSVQDALSSDADVLVASGVEITRAVEAGVAAVGETDVARIPWVLAMAAGGPTPVGLADLSRDVDVVILAGPAAYEARRALASHPV